MVSTRAPIELPEDDVNLKPPDQAEVEGIASAVVSVLIEDASAESGLTDLQRVVMAAVFESMTGHRPLLQQPRNDVDLLEVLRLRNLAFRTRIVQQMILGVLVVRPPSPAVVARIREASRRLGVEEGMIDVAAAFADGQFDLALADFDRNGYTANWDSSRTGVLHATGALTAPWQQAPADPELATRWRSVEALADGSLGLAVSRFYRARGFSYPGTAGSVSPLLAQHDWVHVLADYGATIDNELEVFAFIARANDDPRGFSFLAMVVSLFENGMLTSGAGLFDPTRVTCSWPACPSGSLMQCDACHVQRQHRLPRPRLVRPRASPPRRSTPRVRDRAQARRHPVAGPIRAWRDDVKPVGSRPRRSPWDGRGLPAMGRIAWLTVHPATDLPIGLGG